MDDHDHEPDHDLGTNLDLDLLPPVPLSARKAAAQTPPRPSFLLARKRTHADYYDEDHQSLTVATSSDPAFFSSDEQAPGAENYAVAAGDKRKKRTYKGAWWDRSRTANENQKGTATKKPREFRRNYDSGIFMGSEGSTTEEPLSSDSFSLEEELLREQEQQQQQNAGKGKQNTRSQRTPFLNGTGTGTDDQAIGATSAVCLPPVFQSTSTPSRPKAKLPPSTAAVVPKEHEAVCAIIRDCLDKGKEDVYLSGMSLSSLPTEITTLQTLSKQDEIVPGMLDTGTNLEPHLRLYLANNLLADLPLPIFELRNLRVLSLRQNNLTHIPGSIRELVNLESLNVAGNNLTELPFEIVELIRFGKLRELMTEPNPWPQFRPELLVEQQQQQQQEQQQQQRRRRLYAFSVPGRPGIRYLFYRWPGSRQHTTQESFDGENSGVSSFNFHLRNQATQQQGNNVPSLTETVLRRLSKIDPQRKMDFASLLPSDYAPAGVLRDLETLARRPGQQCTMCGRSIVLPGKEWIEWCSLHEGLEEVDDDEDENEGGDQDHDGNNGRSGSGSGNRSDVRIGGRYSVIAGKYPILPFRRVQCWQGCRGTGTGSDSGQGDWLMRDEETARRRLQKRRSMVLEP
ncbi:hypothetical protein ABEF95_011472 [Exophiala dermatitidis]